MAPALAQTRAGEADNKKAARFYRAAFLLLSMIG